MTSVSSSSSSSSSSELPISLQEYINPFMCILQNLPYVIQNDGKKVLPSNTNSLLQIIQNAGLQNVVSFDAAYDENNSFLRYAVIQFGSSRKYDLESFIQACKLEQPFSEQNHSKICFDNDLPRKGPYLWVARNCYGHDDSFVVKECLHLEDDEINITNVPKDLEDKHLKLQVHEKDVFNSTLR